jgi:HD-like signal output (HDOD) protein
MNLLTRFLHLSDKAKKGAGAEPNQNSFPREGIVRQVPSQKKPISVSLELLKQLFPVRNLSEEELDAFSLGREAEVYGSGSILFQRDQPTESLFYLLEGSICMEIEEGRTYSIEAATPKARFPLCSGKVCSATAYAETDVQVLRVSSKIMSRNISDRTAALEFIDLQNPAMPEPVRDSQLVQAFTQHYHEEALELPSLPDVALKLKNALAQDINIADAVKIVQLDPVIAAKLIHVANSPLYLFAHPVNRCFDAINRLGLMATRSLVMSLSLKQIFSCKNPVIKGKMREAWKRSVYLSALCFALASRNQEVDSEEALLAGLTCDIGVVPFLYFADRFPDEYQKIEEIDLALPYVKGPVGASVLKKWDFPDELVEIPLVADKWLYDSGDRLKLSDIVILANLHAQIGTPRMTDLPIISSIPAYSKLVDRGLSPQYSLKVLQDAKEKIAEATRFFES